MFQVSTLMHDDVSKIPTEKPRSPNASAKTLVNYKEDFFGKPTFLTVSGQLAVEVS